MTNFSKFCVNRGALPTILIVALSFIVVGRLFSAGGQLTIVADEVPEKKEKNKFYLKEQEPLAFETFEELLYGGEDKVEVFRVFFRDEREKEHFKDYQQEGLVAWWGVQQKGFLEPESSQPIGSIEVHQLQGDNETTIFANKYYFPADYQHFCDKYYLKEYIGDILPGKCDLQHRIYRSVAPFLSMENWLFFGKTLAWSLWEFTDEYVQGEIDARRPIDKDARS